MEVGLSDAKRPERHRGGGCCKEVAPRVASLSTTVRSACVCVCYACRERVVDIRNNSKFSGVVCQACYERMAVKARQGGPLG